MLQRSILALGPAASLLLLAQAALAQTGACDQLKATLAARIDPSIRGYALEAVPAGVPVPPGAKVIGNCEGGARKILFFRSGGTTPSSLDAASALGPASAPRAGAAPAQTKPRSAQAPSTPAPLAVSSLPKLNADAHEAVASAGAGEGAQVVDRAAVQPTQAQREMTPTASASIAQQFSEFLGRYWPWLAALGFLLLGGSLWAWLVHHSAYDAAGLPRGPRIN